MSAHDDDDAAVRDRARANRLFADVPPDDVAAAVGQLELLRLAPGDFVFRQGQSAGDGHGDLYLAIDGQLQVVVALPDHQSAPISAIKPDEFFGELALADSRARSASVVAVTPAVVGRLSGAGMDTLLARAPIVYRTLGAALATRLRTASDALVTARVQEERLALVGKTAAALLHDLRNPLGTVMMAAEMLQEGIGKPPELAAKILRAGRFINGMADDLLKYAKGGASVTLAPVASADVVDDVEAFGLVPLEQAGAITVRRQISGACTLSADRHTLSRALLNIVKNATEAMRGAGAGGTLTFELTVTHEQAMFVIADTGPGIPDHLLPVLFQPFASHGKTGGTGLGMALTKSAIDAHGGRISVGRNDGGGTRFVISLPVAAAAAAGGGPAPAA